jgi:hypothetical protein
MKSARSFPAHLLLLLYIPPTYQIVASVSLVVGFFDLRHQVQAPFEVGDYPTITNITEAAQKAVNCVQIVFARRMYVVSFL